MFVAFAFLSVLLAAVVPPGTPSAAQTTIEPDSRAVAVIEVDGRLEVRVGEARTLGEFIGFAGEAALAGELLGVDFEGEVTAAVGPDEHRGLQWSLDRVDVEALHGLVDGSGVTVAVLDSGVRWSHEDLTGAIGEASDCYDPVLALALDL